MPLFAFLSPGLLEDDTLQLKLRATETAEQSIRHAPTYRFDIWHIQLNCRIGHINLRVADTMLITHYVGHIGYGIDPAHRGHHFAERACRLLLPFAARNGLGTIWITCSPDNIASLKTLERLGAQRVETLPVPDDYPMPDGAIRQTCRFRLKH